MDQNQVDHTVLVQHNHMFDNSYFLDVVNSSPDEFTAVIQIDPDDPEPDQTLIELVERGANGIRLPLHTQIADENPRYASLRETVNDLELPVSVQGSPSEFNSERFRRILDSCSDCPIILEHLAGLGSVNRPYDAVEQDFTDVLKYADYSNVYIKIPGLGEICPRPSKLNRQFRLEGVPQLFNLAIKSFSPSQMMWGSDFPPCSSREGYHNTLAAIRDGSFFSQEELDWVLGKTAASVWDIPHTST